MDRIVLFSLLTLLTACGAAPADDKTDEEADADTDADTDSDTDADTDSDTDADIPEWSGSWEVEIDYAYECDKGFGNMESNAGTGSWTLQLSGPSDDLEARVNGNDWYTMNGFGDEGELFLCGSFPLTTLQNDAAPSGNDNQICLEAEEVVSATELRGEMTGTFMDSFGFDCVIGASPIVLTN